MAFENDDGPPSYQRSCSLWKTWNTWDFVLAQWTSTACQTYCKPCYKTCPLCSIISCYTCEEDFPFQIAWFVLYGSLDTPHPLPIHYQ
jgi:hypothetical protein